jgi:hypothetical protein
VWTTSGRAQVAGAAAVLPDQARIKAAIPRVLEGVPIAV